MPHRRVKGTICALWILLTILILPTSGISDEPAPPAVIQAANDGLGLFLNAIPPQDISHYGFSSTEEMTHATLGNPFRVYTITPDKIMSYSREMKLSSLLSETNLWFFPVLCRGEVRTLLTVDLMDGRWKAVAIGSSGLAKELPIAWNKWPRSEGYDHKFVRIYQAKSDFVMVSKESTNKMVPLTSAALALKLLDAKAERGYVSHDIPEVILSLQPLVQEALK